MQNNHDVCGIGNPLIDLLLKVNDDLIMDLNLEKGTFNPLSQNELHSMLKKINHHDIKISPGDSTANTLAGIAKLGGNVIFCGKVGNDEHGAYYEETLESSKVKSKLVKVDGVTGKCICLITPDNERTFAVHLGSCIELRKEEVFENDIKKSKYLHLTGYQLEDINLRKATFHALDIAKQNNVKISIDLADPSLIKRCLDDLKEIVKKYADIVFVNEEEAKAFTGQENEEALTELSKFADIAIIKLGEKGSLIKDKDNVHKINSFTVNAIDTTGAGDMYAAGVLFGLSNKHPLEKCGEIGSYAASIVVQQIGARLNKEIDIKHLL